MMDDGIYRYSSLLVNRWVREGRWRVTYEAGEEMAWREWSVAAMQSWRFGLLFVEENMWNRFREAVRRQRRKRKQQALTREEEERLKRWRWQRTFGVMWEMDVASAREVLEKERERRMMRRQEAKESTQVVCEFCHWCYHRETLPFAHCWHCQDKPSKHHGRCCPLKL